MVCCNLRHGPGLVCLPVSDTTLFENVHVFDGLNESLILNQDVLISGHKVLKIATKGTIDGALIPDDAAKIAGNGTRILMPGLIDVHWHTMLANMSQASLLSADFGYMAIVAAEGAQDTLMRGFTSVRDVGGNCHGVKRATDEGKLVGPRVYPSGAFISQTSGHFDFRGPHDTPASPGDSMDYFARTNMAVVADGVPEVLKRVREQLRMGATQIKIAAGGGVSSYFDPVDVAEYTYDEIKAAVDAAKSWNTYVCAHVFSKAGIETAVRAGVKSIEHGNFASHETFQLMKDNDVWLSMQPILNDEDAIFFPPGSDNEKKYLAVCAGTETAVAAARDIGVKTAFGTDVLFDKKLATKQGKLLAKLTKWYTPFETLKMATSTNAELLKMCGPRDPYPGDLGVVKEGALADLILVEGNPLEDINLITNPDSNFVCIMKNGVVYKDTTGQQT